MLTLMPLTMAPLRSRHLQVGPHVARVRRQRCLPMPPRVLLTVTPQQERVLWRLAQAHCARRTFSGHIAHTRSWVAELCAWVLRAPAKRRLCSSFACAGSS
jgi:hypothetical protein